MSSQPSPAPILLAVRIRSGKAEMPDWAAAGHRVLARVHCALCTLEYLVLVNAVDGHTAGSEDKARQVVMLTHPRHPDTIDVENPWG